jgi:hypothetical protein
MFPIGTNNFANYRLTYLEFTFVWNVPTILPKLNIYYIYIILYVFIFLFVFASAAGQYFSILTGQYFSILTGSDQYNVFFRILSELVFCLRYAITKTCHLTDLHVLSII